MSDSVAALFQRLTQGVYVVAWPTGSYVMPSQPPGLEAHTAAFPLWPFAGCYRRGGAL
jgi:hypothetical protein